MSMEDLKEQGVLLPEEEWGAHNLKTTSPQLADALLFIIAIIGCVMVYYGDGNKWTWIGIVIFFLAFFSIIWLNDRAVKKQRERFREERSENK